MSISIPVKLDLVIVTFNRLEKLKKALSCYEKQTSPFRNLILVNNCSTDGTKEYIDEWQREKTFFGKIVIHTDENLGGSGGFYLGQKKAMELGADWVFVADDDAYAQPDMVEKFYDYLGLHDTSKISAICAAVYDTDDNICLYHRDNYKVEKGRYFRRINAPSEEYEKDSFEIDILSYVGSFLNAQALRKEGLVNPQYFIYFDDSEHSFRLKRYGTIIVVPNLKIIHEGGNETDRDNKQILASWRDYYLERNFLHMLLKHKSFVAAFYVYRFIRDFLKKGRHHSIYEKVKCESYKDAIRGKLGKHDVFQPGWRILKD